MEVRILGPLQVVLDSGQVVELGDRQGRLLTRLSLADGPVPFADLAAALTDAGAVPLSRRVLDLHLSALAGALGSQRVRVDDAGAALDLGPGELDARDFESEAAVALTSAAEGDRSTAHSLLVSALARWRGPVYGGRPIPGAITAVERLGALRTMAEQTLAQLSLPRAADDSAGQVVTLLLTDVVGSTAQWELAPASMHAALEHHDDLITGIVATHGGRCLKHRGEGDSTFSVFESAVGAVLAAAAILDAMQGIPWPDGVDMKVRMSVYSGPAIERAGDYFGPTVNRAARLRSMARGGSALVAGSTADLVRDELAPPLSLVRVGLLPLRDIPEPEEAFELVDARAEAERNQTGDAADAEPTELARPGGPRWAQLPVALRMSGTSFSGRQDALADLLATFRAARRGLGRVVFLGGDPGIGKTRLTAELARRVRLEGGIVAFGRADPEQGLPYRTYVDSFSDVVAHAPEPLLDGYVDAYGGELSRIVPVLARRVPWLPAPAAGDPGTERHRLFDAARGLLEHLATEGPVLLILDDLHDAGAETIHLTRYLVDEAAKLPVVIVATYRDGEVEADSDLGRLLTHARRAKHVTMTVLPGLQAGDLIGLVGELLPDRSDRDELTAQLSEETGGNPLFTIELLRTLAAEPPLEGATALPTTDTVRDVIGRRVERLGPAAGEALTMAAIVGREFDLSLVARALGAEEDGVLVSFERAVAAHLVVDGATPGSFVFAHGLVPHVLEGSLTATRRARAHLAAADAIEALWGTDGVTFIDAVARHLVAAGPLADAPRTVAAARRAGDQAMAHLAPEQAAHSYADALARAEGNERIELLIALGTAQRQAGLRAFRETLLDASRLAMSAGEHDLLLAAVLANNRGDRARTFFVDQERVEMLRAAIDTGADADSPQRARALALLALEMSHDADWQARLARSDAALAMARRLGDGPTLCDVLRLRFEAIRLPETVATRLVETHELVETAQAVGDPVQLAFGLLWRARVCLELGDVAGLDENVARAAEVAANIREPFIRWNLAAHGSYRAVMRGDLVAAEGAAVECYGIARRDGQPDADAVLASHLLVIRDAQGRLAEHVDALRRAVAAVPDSGSLRAVLIFVLAETGAEEEAVAELDAMAATGFATIVRDLIWMTSMYYLARAASRVGHDAVARLVHDALEPWADQVVWSGSTAHGPVAQLLSITALVMGDADGALGDARAALAASQRMDCPLWAVEALEAEAVALAATGSDDARRAAALAEAGTIAARHGFARFSPLYEQAPQEVPAHG